MLSMKDVNLLIPSGSGPVAAAGPIIFLVIDRYFC